MIVGAASGGVALMLLNIPLAMGAVGLWVAGFIGPGMYAIKKTANPRNAGPSVTLEEQEDAAVDAFVHRMEAGGRYQAMIANDERLRQGRVG